MEYSISVLTLFEELQKGGLIDTSRKKPIPIKDLLNFQASKDQIKFDPEITRFSSLRSKCALAGLPFGSSLHPMVQIRDKAIPQWMAWILRNRKREKSIGPGIYTPQISRFIIKEVDFRS